MGERIIMDTNLMFPAIVTADTRFNIFKCGIVSMNNVMPVMGATNEIISQIMGSALPSPAPCDHYDIHP